MDLKVLVVSKNYTPVNVLRWEECFTLLYQGRVEVVEYYDEYVRSATQTHRVPSIVRYNRGKRHKLINTIKFSKRNMYVRDNGLCQYCGKHLTLDKATLDHVFPRAKGGRKSWHNSVLACFRCNNDKGMRTPEEAGLVLRGSLIAPYVATQVADIVSLKRSQTIPDCWKPYIFSSRTMEVTHVSHTHRVS